jgi:hypothetical protein
VIGTSGDRVIENQNPTTPILMANPRASALIRGKVFVR